MSEITVAALQLELSSHDEAANIAAVSALVEEAASRCAPWPMDSKPTWSR